MGFRSTVHELIKDASIIVTRIEVETVPGARVEVVADKPGRGGGVFCSPQANPAGLFILK